MRKLLPCGHCSFANTYKLFKYAIMSDTEGQVDLDHAKKHAGAGNGNGPFWNKLCVPIHLPNTESPKLPGWMVEDSSVKLGRTPADCDDCCPSPQLSEKPLQCLATGLTIPQTGS